MQFLVSKVLCVFPQKLDWFDNVQVLLNIGHSSMTQYQ